MRQANSSRSKSDVSEVEFLLALNNPLLHIPSNFSTNLSMYTILSDSLYLHVSSFVLSILRLLLLRSFFFLLHPYMNLALLCLELESCMYNKRGWPVQKNFNIQKWEFVKSE